jgi:hydroxymethylbilane synthase
VVVKTSGDRLSDRPLQQVGGKGLFIKELEEALLAGRIDLAVHSMKDLPAELAAGFALAAVTSRADVRDVLVLRDERALPAAKATAADASAGGLDLLPALAALPRGIRVGTGSLRRRAQLAALRPDLEVVAMRGNVDTRLGKLAAGEFDAIVLAAAGLARLGIRASASPLDPRAFLPAPGQGALALESRAGDREVIEACAALDDPPTRSACAAERAFLRSLGASCQVPVAAFARLSAEREAELTIDGLVASLDGRRVLRGAAHGQAAQAEAIGARLADELLARGAGELLAALEP